MYGRSSGRWITLSAIVFAACVGDQSKPLGPDMEISDGSRPGGTLGFYFLPPMVPDAVTPTGPFDPTLLPQVLVTVCELNGSSCGAEVARFTPGGPLFGRVTTSQFTIGHHVIEHYLAVWRTDGPGLSTSRTYRATAFAAGRPLGFADVKLVRTIGEAAVVDRTQFTPWVKGLPLPIRFRLETVLGLPPGEASALVLTGLPASLAAGDLASLTVTARDASGQVATGYRGTVTVTATDPLAVLPAPYTFTDADAGIHTFTDLSFRTPGSVTVHASDAANAGLFGEFSLTVTPGPAVALELTGLVNGPAGATQTLTVTARDAFGNVATGYTGTIAFSSDDDDAVLPADYTFTAADAGAHTFPVVLHTAGSITVTATDATMTGSQTVTITAATAATLVVAGLVDGAAAGTAQTLTVTALDASGNVATEYTGTIAFTSIDPQASLPDPYSFTAADAGVRSFPNTTLRTAGPVSVTATDQVVATITGGQTVTVVAAAAAELLLTGLPDPATAGVANDVTVTAHDAFGNTATGYAGTVAFSSTDPNAVLPLPYGFQPGDAGVHTFTAGVTFKTAGTQSLSASDGTLTATVATIVEPAAAAALQFTVQPAAAVEVAPIAPPVVVTAFDPFGNPAAGFTGQVTIGIGTNPTGGVLSGTTLRDATLGVATFDDLSISAAGTGYTLVASAGGLTSATSDPFNVTASGPVAVHWINAAGGLWSVGTNWSTGLAPTAEQAAFIDLAGTYTVTLDVNATVHSLTLGATSGLQTLIAGTGRTLTLSTSGTILSTGRMQLTSAMINGSGTLTNAAGGTLSLSVTSTINTALINAGTLLSGVPPFFSTSTINGTFTTVAGSLVRVHAGGSNSAGLTVANGFVNHGTIELTKALDNVGEAALAVTTGTLVNAVDGTIRSLLGTGGGRRLSLQLDNQGTVTLDHVLLIDRASADHVNSGVIQASGGNLTLTQSGTTPSFTNTGTITVAPGRTWTITGGSFTQAAGAVLDGGGAMTLTTVNPAVFGTAFTLGALSLNSSTANFTTDVSTADVTLSITNSTVNGPGTLTNAVGKTLPVSQTSTINTALINAGTLLSGVPPFFSASTINGPFTTVAGSLVRIHAGGSNSATLTVANGFTNHGTIELTKALDNSGEARLVVPTGTLVNAVGGTIRSLLGSGGGRTITAQLDNQGTVILDHVLAINVGSADHSNSGVIQAGGGNLTLTQSGTTPSFTNTGTITVAPGRTWTITGGSFTQAAAAVLDGGGAMTLTNVNPAAFGSAITLSSLTLSGTTASFAVAVSTATMALNNATLNGPGTITNPAGGTLTLSQTSTINAPLINAGALQSGVAPFFSTSTINGPFNSVAGSLVRIQAGGSNSGTLTVANGFTNHGTIELTKVSDNVGEARLVVTTGTLVNAVGGTIRSLLGSGGGRRLSLQLDNQGSVILDHVLLVDRSSADHVSSGSINVSGGDLTVAHTGTTPSFANTGSVTLAAGRALVNTGAAGVFTNGAAGTVSIAIAGTAVNQFGRITIAGTADLAGTLNADLVGGFTPAAADRFRFMTFTARTGTLVPGTLPPGFTLESHATDLELVAP